MPASQPDDPAPGDLAAVEEAARSLLTLAFWPVVLYPPGFPLPNRRGEASGKEPFGTRWGLNRPTWTQLLEKIQYFQQRGYVPNIGLCLGPGRGPGGTWLIDLEGDGELAEESRAKLLGGNMIVTAGWSSARGRHQLLTVDDDRMTALLGRLKTAEVKNKPGVYHFTSLPGLELRVGGLKPDGTTKQLQSACPPSVGTDGKPREWEGALDVAPLAAIPTTAVPEPEAPAGPTAASARPSAGTGGPRARGRVDRVDAWLKRALESAYGKVAMAAEGSRHAMVLAQTRTLAGYLWYGQGFIEADLVAAMTAAANHAAPERPEDNARCVLDAVANGKASPLELPPELHAIATGAATGKARPSTSSNGTGHHHTNGTGAHATAGDPHPDADGPTTNAEPDPEAEALRAAAEAFASYAVLREDRDFIGRLARLQSRDEAAAEDIIYRLRSRLGRQFLARDFAKLLRRYGPAPEPEDHHDDGGGHDRCDRYIDTGNAIKVMTEDGARRLCQFSARIISQVIRHGPGDDRREYTIRLTRDNGATTAEATIAAADYEAMGWVHAQFGDDWVIEPGKGVKDEVRHAIQVFSVRDGHPTRHVYEATGWHTHEGRPLYLHGGGAIGADGPTDAVGVELSPGLARYRLPDPPADRQTLQAAARAHFGILDLGKADRPGARPLAAVLVTLPFRALLGPLDGVVHFSGGTATLKTSSARLVYQHFATDIATSDPMLVSWGATPGSLQRYAYEAKDVALIVDELKGEKAVAAATEFIQAQGNLKSRDRMTQSLRLAPSLDPRGTVLSTGETDPTSQSTLGRMLIVRFSPWTVDREILSRCQADGEEGCYAALMVTYVGWLAPRLDDIRRQHRNKVIELRDRFQSAIDADTVHPRHPMLAAELSAGYRPLLQFAVDVEAITPLTAQGYAEAVDRYLIELLREQAESQREFSPAQRFVSLLVEGLRAKRFHLKSIDSDEAPRHYAGACGWHKDWLYQGGDGGGQQYLDWCVPPNSKMVGFIDETAGEVYMGAEALKTVAQIVARDQGERFENPTKIGRDLAEAGLVRLPGGSQSGFQIRKRIKDHGLGWYYALSISQLFDLAGEDQA